MESFIKPTHVKMINMATEMHKWLYTNVYTYNNQLYVIRETLYFLFMDGLIFLSLNLQGSKEIRQWPINWCTSPIKKHKITPFVE